MCHYSPSSRSNLVSLVTLTALLLIAGCQSESSENQTSSPPPLPENELTVEDPWIQPARAGSTSILSMTIANGLEEADTLLRVRAPIVDSSVVHTSPSDTAAGVETSESLVIPARARTVLHPESTHVQMVTLNQTLEENSTPILNLEFAQSGLQRIRVPVQTSPPSNSQ